MLKGSCISKQKQSGYLGITSHAASDFSNYSNLVFWFLRLLPASIKYIKYLMLDANPDKLKATSQPKMHVFGLWSTRRGPMQQW